MSNGGRGQPDGHGPPAGCGPVAPVAADAGALAQLLSRAIDHLLDLRVPARAGDGARHRLPQSAARAGVGRGAELAPGPMSCSTRCRRPRTSRSSSSTRAPRTKRCAPARWPSSSWRARPAPTGSIRRAPRADWRAPSSTTSCSAPTAVRMRPRSPTRASPSPARATSTSWCRACSGSTSCRRACGASASSSSRCARAS